MTLILSSCDFSNPVSKNTILENLPKPIEQCKMMYIPNETATKKEIRSDKFVLRAMSFGFLRENIIIFDYYNAEAYTGLDIDVLYAGGGNTFATLRRLKMHGFEQELVRYIKSGVTYIGGSAGAHIITKDLSHLTRFDKPPADMTDMKGLGVFDGILVCHYSDDRRELYESLVADGKFKVYSLTNEESLVVKG